jgi:hypothetical protein
MNGVNGASGTTFENLSLSIGQVYDEDWPDDIDAVNGSQVILHYNQSRNGTIPRNAGIAYSGTFGESSEPGKVIYLPFALETVFSLSQRADLMNEVLNYFYSTTPVNGDNQDALPVQFKLSQNYPNPFNPSTTIEYSIPNLVRKASFAHHSNKALSQSGDWLYNTELKIYDILGREVAILVNTKQLPGIYKVTWVASDHASGIYFYTLNAGSFNETKKMILLK